MLWLTLRLYHRQSPFYCCASNSDLISYYGNDVISVYINIHSLDCLPTAIMNREPPLARPLFTSRLLHESSQLRRRALRRQTNRAPHILGLICYSVVLLAAMLLPVALNDSHHNLLTGITNLIDEGQSAIYNFHIHNTYENTVVIPQFLSSYPMNNSTLPSWVDYRGQYLMGKQGKYNHFIHFMMTCWCIFITLYIRCSKRSFLFIDRGNITVIDDLFLCLL